MFFNVLTELEYSNNTNIIRLISSKNLIVCYVYSIHRLDDVSFAQDVLAQVDDQLDFETLMQLKYNIILFVSVT